MCVCMHTYIDIVASIIIIENWKLFKHPATRILLICMIHRCNEIPYSLKSNYVFFDIGRCP